MAPKAQRASVLLCSLLSWNERANESPMADISPERKATVSETTIRLWPCATLFECGLVLEKRDKAKFSSQVSEVWLQVAMNSAHEYTCFPPRIFRSSENFCCTPKQSIKRTTHGLGECILSSLDLSQPFCFVPAILCGLTWQRIGSVWQRSKHGCESPWMTSVIIQ